MKTKLIYMVLLLLIATPFVSAYGGGGGGILVPLPSKGHNVIFSHSFYDINTYAFECSHFSSGIIANKHFQVYYLCPKNYYLESMNVNIGAEKNNGTIEVYVFEPEREIKIKGNPVIKSYMVRTTPMYKDDFYLKIVLSKENKYRAYTSRDSARWEEVKNFKSIKSKSSTEDVYGLIFNKNARYLVVTKIQ